MGVARVVIEHLTKVFSGPAGETIRAVDDLSLAIEDRELLVLLGPSGCGKTTTLRLLAGLEEPTAGTIAINGQVVNSVPPKDRDVAMVFQNPALYPHMTVYENLAFGLQLRRCPKAEIQQRVQAAAERLGLRDCLARRPMALSGGQRQRVALGRALVRQPGLFLLDEPLSNLDTPSRARLRLEISRLHARLGSTMVYVTHDQVEAMTLGDRIAVLKEGVIQQLDGPLNLYHHPANLFVAGFIGSPPMNFFSGTLAVQDQALCFRQSSESGSAAPVGITLRIEDSLAARLRSWSGRKVVLGLRPENIVPSLAVPEAPPEQTVEATVELIETAGRDTWLHLVTAGGQSLVARLPSAENIPVGRKLACAFQMRQAHFFDLLTEQRIEARA